MQFILIGNDHVIAFGKAADRLCEIQRAKSNLSGSSVDDAVFHDQRLIDKKGARWHEQHIFVCAGDDVHFTGHFSHQIVGGIFHLQNDSIALGDWVGCGLDRCNVRDQRPGSISI